MNASSRMSAPELPPNTLDMLSPIASETADSSPPDSSDASRVSPELKCAYTLKSSVTVTPMILPLVNPAMSSEAYFVSEGRASAPMSARNSLSAFSTVKMSSFSWSSDSYALASSSSFATCAWSATCLVFVSVWVALIS